MTKTLLWLAFYSLPLIAFLANTAQTREEVVPRSAVQGFIAPAKVTINRSTPTSLAFVARAPMSPARPNRRRLAAGEVAALQAYVQTRAREHGVNPTLAVWIVKHESSFNPDAKGDGEASRGLWQISKIYHPEVSDAEAFNVASSTEWSLQRIRAGKAAEWSTYRFCRTLYPNCPF